MREIPLTKGRFALVDDVDFEWLSQWKWYVSNRGYAVRKPREIKPKTIFMHRLVNGTPDDFYTDHINHNKLDNRKINLRTVTDKENKYNRPLQKNNVSGVAGVSWDKLRQKWSARISINNRIRSLGRYENKSEAIIARQNAERIFYVI